MKSNSNFSLKHRLLALLLLIILLTSKYKSYFHEDYLFNETSINVINEHSYNLNRLRYLNYFIVGVYSSKLY